jgi:hypothetical protein
LTNVPVSDEGRLDDSTRRIVILDTNVYRQVAYGGDVDIVRQRFQRLRSEEREHGVQALAHALVVLELLARLADPTTPNYAVVKAAIVGLFEHCHMTAEGERHLAVVPDPDSQLCVSLYGEHPDALVGGLNVLQSLVKLIAEDPSERHLDQMRSDLQALQRIVIEREREFVRDLKVQIGEDPDSNEWRPLKDNPEERARLMAYLEGTEAEMQVMRSFVLRAQRLLGRNETPEDVDSKAAFLLRHLRVPVRIFNQWVLHPSRANTLWDLHICFSVGRDNTINNRPIWFVTGEKKLKAAAEAVVSDTLVLSYDEYRKHLSSGAV